MRSTSSLLITLVLAGCAVDAGGAKEALDDPAFADGDDSADSFTRRLQLRGTIAFGESRDDRYADRGFAGYLFTGRRGARVQLDLTGHDNDPVLYLYGPHRGRSWTGARPIAINDDSAGTLNSRITARLPGDGTYLVLAREYSGEPGSFTLALGCTGAECRVECGGDDSCPNGSACNRVVCIRAPCPSYCEAIDPITFCESDEDCVSVRTGCCPCSSGGRTRAVNASYADDVAPECDPTRPIACPAVYLCRDERPACQSNRCEMVPASDDAVCPEHLCGPALGLANMLCPDGEHTSGPTGRCLRNEDGSCGWEVLSCPETPAAPCYVGGCSSQVCSDREGVITTCEFRPEYACYRESFATCERQGDGSCGWTPNADLSACIAAAGGR